jgi:hypothetical protein
VTGVAPVEGSLNRCRARVGEEQKERLWREFLRALERRGVHLARWQGGSQCKWVIHTAGEGAAGVLPPFHFAGTELVAFSVRPKR